MQFQGAKHPRYYTTHGAKQQAYCRHKAAALKNYVRTPPKIRQNKGWGMLSCVFTTVTSPVFDFIRTLCYRPDSTGKLKKRVTKSWLKQLTWEGIAYWYMDDGSLSGKSITFSTHSFTEEEVDLLVTMLKDRGIAARKVRVNKKDRRSYYTIRLNLVATRTFVQKVAKYVHPTLQYKLAVPAPVIVQCAYCGVDIIARNNQVTAETPCCKKEACQRERHRELNKQYADANRATINQKHRDRYHEDLPAARAKGRERARAYRSANNEKVNAYKRAYRARKRAARVVEMVTCTFCGKEIPRANRKKDAPQVACSSPACRRAKHRLNSIRSRQSLRSAS